MSESVFFSRSAYRSSVVLAEKVDSSLNLRDHRSFRRMEDRSVALGVRVSVI